MDQTWSTDPDQWRQASSSKPHDSRNRAQARAAKRQAASNKLDKALELGYSGIMENKKITMWWNLPPEELDEVIEANDGKLNPFMHIEEDEKIHNRS